MVGRPLGLQFFGSKIFAVVTKGCDPPPQQLAIVVLCDGIAIAYE